MPSPLRLTVGLTGAAVQWSRSRGELDPQAAPATQIRRCTREGSSDPDPSRCDGGADPDRAVRRGPESGRLRRLPSRL